MGRSTHPAVDAAALWIMIIRHHEIERDGNTNDDVTAKMAPHKPHIYDRFLKGNGGLYELLEAKNKICLNTLLKYHFPQRLFVQLKLQKLCDNL